MYTEAQDMTPETMANIMHDYFGNYPELIYYLENMGYYYYPASKDHHGAEWGGLFKHSLQVTYELQKLTNLLDLEWERPESPVIIGMLHDVCKLDDYIIAPYGELPEEPEIYINPEKMYPGHGEKSLLMMMGLIDLTEEEKMCIRYHMGAFTDSKQWDFYNRAVSKYPNVLMAHTADMIASQVKGV